MLLSSGPHWLERAPALPRPSTSYRQSAAQAPWGAGLTGDSPGLLGPDWISAAPGVFWVPGIAAAWGDSKRRAQQLEQGLCSWGGHCRRWLILHSSRCLCLPVLRSLAWQWESAERHMLTELLLRPTAAGVPSLLCYPFSVMQKGLLLGELLDVEGSANSAQRAPGLE